MRAFGSLLLAAVFLLPTTAHSGAVITEVGEWKDPGIGHIETRVTRGSEHAFLNGAGIACMDERAIKGIAFGGLSVKQLEAIRSLIDQTIAELKK